MKEVNTNEGKTYSVEFNSLNDFYSYICNTPINEVFRWESELSSVKHGKSFKGTETWEEAIDLFQHGWTQMATKLNKKIQAKQNDFAYTNKMKSYLSVAGYNPIVPLYLSNCPTNMMNTRMVKMKQKVLNITKSINYNCMTTTQKMEEESIKALQIVRKLEAQGFRVNLYISLGTEKLKSDKREILCKVKIKDAKDKLNISKVAFPMVHPSMLRRLFFRFIEVYPNVTESYHYGYGSPVKYDRMKEVYKDDIVLPAFIDNELENFNNVEELKAKVENEC